MKTFSDLGFTKDWENERTFVYKNPDYQRGGGMRVSFDTFRKTWATHGWNDPDAEVAAAILLECIMLGWITFEGGEQYGSCEKLHRFNANM